MVNFSPSLQFDSAMVAFLDCLQQFAGEVERRHGFSLPYEMDKGKIRDNNTGQVSTKNLDYVRFWSIFYPYFTKYIFFDRIIIIILRSRFIIIRFSLLLSVSSP